MGLSRRQFTKEFKVAAVRRLEQGVSIAEVARGLEVNPNVRHRSRRELSCRVGQRVSRQRKAALVRRPGCGTGTEDRSAGP
ncbi:MAG: transposase [Acidobacteriaceae bacterium]|nr:transposase [Acidobacteriaceae bacterium]